MITYIGQHILPLQDIKRDVQMRPIYTDRVEHIRERYINHGVIKPLTVGVLKDEYHLVGGYHRFTVLEQTNKQEHSCLLYKCETKNDLILLADIDNDLMEMSQMDRALKYQEIAKRNKTSFGEVCVQMNYSKTSETDKIKNLEALLDIPPQYQEKVAPSLQRGTREFPLTMSHPRELMRHIQDKKLRDKIYELAINEAKEGRVYTANPDFRKIGDYIKRGLSLEEAFYKVKNPSSFTPGPYTNIKLKIIRGILSDIYPEKNEKALDLFGQKSTEDSTAGILLSKGFQVHSFGNEVEKYMEKKPNLFIHQVRDIYELSIDDIGRGYKTGIIDPLGWCPLRFVLDVFEECCEYGIWVITDWNIRSAKPSAAYPRILRADHGKNLPKNTQEQIELITIEAKMRGFITNHIKENEIHVLTLQKQFFS